MEKVIVHQDFAGFEDLFKKFGARDEQPMADEDPDPVAKFFEAAPVAVALGKSNRASVVFDLAPPPESDVDDDSTSPFYKSPVIIRGDQRPTLAKKLGIVRTEEITTANGDVWIHAFNSGNELVDARLIKSAE